MRWLLEHGLNGWMVPLVALAAGAASRRLRGRLASGARRLAARLAARLPARDVAVVLVVVVAAVLAGPSASSRTQPPYDPHQVPLADAAAGDPRAEEVDLFPPSAPPAWTRPDDPDQVPRYVVSAPLLAELLLSGREAGDVLGAEVLGGVPDGRGLVYSLEGGARPCATAVVERQPVPDRQLAGWQLTRPGARRDGFVTSSVSVLDSSRSAHQVLVDLRTAAGRCRFGVVAHREPAGVDELVHLAWRTADGRRDLVAWRAGNLVVQVGTLLDGYPARAAWQLAADSAGDWAGVLRRDAADGAADRRIGF